MKKFYFLAALVAGTALTSCTSEDDLALSPPEVNVEDGYAPIVFSSVKNNITRADVTGAAAADSLGKKFVVYGYKGSETATLGSKVFDNYLVEWTENTANTTESNSTNWEYVDKTPIHWATVNGITKQTIKYWDYSRDQYDFIAWSTGNIQAIYTGSPTADKQVLVSAIVVDGDNSSNPHKLTNAYTFEGTAKALRQCYIADLVTVNKTGTPGVGEVTGYGQPVTLRFRQLGTKVRIALYETIPGYSVKDVEFYSAAASDDAQATPAKIFTTAENQIFTEGKYTISFPTVDDPTNADNNQAHIEFAPKEENSVATAQATTVEWGPLNYTIRESGESSEDAIYLGRTSNTASFAGAADNNYYVVYLPNQEGTNLNLRVNYTLESIDGSGETIDVKGATAQVPLIYAQWKPGYAYTYLFKISDKTNGYTGLYDPTNPDGNTYDSNPAGLYPITFDAVVVNAEEDATQETITLVSTPSITSYQKGSKVVDNDEYLATTGDIFVTVNDGSPAYTAVTANSLEAGKTYFKSATGENPFVATGEEENPGSYFEIVNPETNNTLSTGALQTLTGKVALYTIPDGKTEAEVIDALSYYYTKADDNATYSVANPAPTSEEEFNKAAYYTRSGEGTEQSPYDYTKATNFVGGTTYYTQTNATSGNTKGRSNIDLTGALFTLVNQVEFGADGNVIPVGADQALRFTPSAGTYAFVYTKNEGSTSVIYKAKSFDKGASVSGYYRYTLEAATGGDVQAGTIYFKDDDASTDMITPFLGQTVNNLYLDDQGNEIASGYAVTNTPYYYTVDRGQHYIEAHNVAYAANMMTGLYEENTAYDPETVGSEPYVATNDHSPLYKVKEVAEGADVSKYFTYDATNGFTKAENTAVNGTVYYEYCPNGNGKAYYYNVATTGNDPDYRLCVFLPQQTTDLYVINDTDTSVAANVTACGDTDVAVKGMTYFDKYTKDNSERYAKVIKVQ